MTINILTLFPDMFKGPFSESMIKRAQDNVLVSIHIHQLRKWAIDKRGTVDDHPFGGGPGMLIRPEPIFNAVEEIKQNAPTTNNLQPTTILLDAGGKRFTQQKAQELSEMDSLIFICGHYEGVDYRVHEHLADEVLSIGDFVLTGGELPCMLMVDSIVRLIPGVLNKVDATTKESFSTLIDMSNEFKKSKTENPQPTTHNSQLLVEYPQYTKPVTFRGWEVPELLRSGHHGNIETWKKEQAHKRTKRNRPDLLQ